MVGVDNWRDGWWGVGGWTGGWMDGWINKKVSMFGLL